MLTLEERETTVNFNAVDKTASIYTSQPEVWQRLGKIPGFRLLEEGKINGKVVSKEFECPRSFVRWGKRGLMIGAPAPRTDRQREASREALKIAHFRSGTPQDSRGLRGVDTPDGGIPRGEVLKV
ncbi:MAG: hypothetical protein ACK4WF_04150 [Candidatus Brocadiales bacterium]